MVRFDVFVEDVEARVRENVGEEQNVPKAEGMNRPCRDLYLYNSRSKVRLPIRPSVRTKRSSMFDEKTRVESIPREEQSRVMM